MPSDHTDILALAQEFLVRCGDKVDLAHYQEADELHQQFIDLPKPLPVECKKAKETLEDLLQKYRAEAMTRLLSKASGGDQTSLDIVARITRDDKEEYTKYFARTYRVSEVLSDEDLEAAWQCLKNYYGIRSHEPPSQAYWQHVFTRADQGIRWAVKELVRGASSQELPFRKPEILLRVAEILAKEVQRSYVA